MKFCAIHSSAALAVNSFAPLTEQPANLRLFDVDGATRIQFEKQLPVIAGRRPCNLDVWIERSTAHVGIESKLLEYLLPKKPEFAPAYDRLKPPSSEACWWNVYENAKQGSRQYLDIAQLLKHYFALSRYGVHVPNTHVQLLYLFWEPVNWPDIEECRQHREEVQALERQVADSRIPLRWMTYADLWQSWSGFPQLAQHAAALKQRYLVEI